MQNAKRLKPSTGSNQSWYYVSLYPASLFTSLGRGSTRSIRRFAPQDDSFAVTFYF